jgi:hypothetical protein
MPTFVEQNDNVVFGCFAFDQLKLVIWAFNAWTHFTTFLVLETRSLVRSLTLAFGTGTSNRHE